MPRSIRLVVPWCLLFLVVNFAVWQDGGTNPASRFAAIRAMSRLGTFSIDKLRHWTVDRAETADGRFYSNKAPGPAMLAVPLAWVLDRLHVSTHEGVGQSRRPSLGYKMFVCFALQGLPMALLVALLGKELLRRGVPPPGVHYAALAILFGNTVSLLVNMFFGHAVTAWLLLGVVLAAWRGAFFWMGLAFGLAVLGEYSIGALAPLALLMAALEPGRGTRLRGVGRFLAGGLLPAALWIWYHTACFGGPFTIALQYQNPVFADRSVEPGTLRAVMAPLPRPAVIQALLVGRARGILPTQPWVLVTYVAAFLVLARRRFDLDAPKTLLGLTLVGLPVLLCLNAGFGGWHGGWSPGPRYLSPLLPLFGVLAALAWERIGRLGRAVLWLALLPALVLRVMAFCAGEVLYRYLGSLWGFYWGQLGDRMRADHGLRLAFVLVLSLLTLLWVMREARSMAERRSSGGPVPPPTPPAPPQP